MYWTANTPMGQATLCERCALLAMNMASLGFVRRPFGSMVEALSALNAKCIEQGIEPMELPCSDYGICGNCGEDKFEPVAS